MSRPQPPQTTPLPPSIFTLAMSPAVPSIPPQEEESSHSTGSPSTKGHRHEFKPLKLRFEIRHLTHPGAKSFLAAVNCTDVLTTAVQNVLRILYTSPSCSTTTVPTTRSVTLILRDMGGVAYTTGSELDSDHKEVHFSLDYISRIASHRVAEEITGVVTHELVHCLQYNGHGTCPGGLIEGIADWVRLQCRLEPPHWKRDADSKWDAGYQHTAYFLDYLEERFGSGTIQRINETLRTQKYEEKPFWTGLVGRPVEQLWKDYGEKLKEETGVDNKDDAK